MLLLKPFGKNNLSDSFFSFLPDLNREPFKNRKTRNGLPRHIRRGQNIEIKFLSTVPLTLVSNFKPLNENGLFHKAKKSMETIS
jgi:hypothetical protein